MSQNKLRSYIFFGSIVDPLLTSLGLWCLLLFIPSLARPRFVACRYALLKLLAITGIGMANVRTPERAQAAPKHLPKTPLGMWSPYPTVVMDTIVYQKVPGIEFIC